MSILEKLKLQIEHLCVLFKMFLQLPLLRICMIAVRALVHLFVCMSWFSMLLQIDFFRKLLVIILTCFVTSCPHENNWHVFPKCLFLKNLNHKLSTYVSYSRCFYNFPFWKYAWSQLELLYSCLFIWTGWVYFFKMSFPEKC